MSKEQRRPYEEKALLEKNNLRAAKYTSEGIEVEKIERQEREEQRYTETMKKEIVQEIEMANKVGGIKDKLFFIVHVNTFCFCQPEDRYYPAEIGIAAFTLETGILSQNVFHRMILPGMPPVVLMPTDGLVYFPLLYPKKNFGF